MMQDLSKRFRSYRDISGGHPLYGKAACRTESSLKLSEPTPGAGFYLYGFIPAIMGFAGWTLEEAVRSGKKRLYFLSRDGHQICLAARRLAELRKLPVECRYLHVSRYAMRVPAYHLDMEHGLEQICSNGMEVTLERVLKRGALTEEEALRVAERIGRKEAYRDILDRRRITELKDILRKEPQFLNYVKAHSMEAYDNTMGYLQQEGLLSDVPYAIVDSGWVGTFQQSLSTLLRSRMPHIRLEGYYFGLYEIPDDADIRDYHAWYFSPRAGLRRKVYFSNSLFEAVCGADEGMTVGYCQENGRYLPRLDPKGNPNGKVLRKEQKVLECFLEQYARAEEESALTGSRRNLDRSGMKRSVNRLFTLLMAKPSMPEAVSFGGLLFSDDVLPGNYRETAARLTAEEIRDLYILRRLAVLSGMRKGTIRESAWIEGSIVRCGMHRCRVRKNLRHIRWYKWLVYGRKQLRAWTHIVRWERNDH
ncbi:MAG: hypothetical protein NC305_04215 [Lachnospiraceae bacterium]|nr:hypothetical protein [Lachnospiraceae bacterium]